MSERANLNVQLYAAASSLPYTNIYAMLLAMETRIV